MVNTPLNNARLDAFDNFFTKVKSTKIDITAQAHFIESQKGWISTSWTQRQNSIGIWMRIQVSHYPVFNLCRILTGIDHRVADVNSKTIRKTGAALGNNDI